MRLATGPADELTRLARAGRPYHEEVEVAFETLKDRTVPYGTVLRQARPLLRYRKWLPWVATASSPRGPRVATWASPRGRIGQEGRFDDHRLRRRRRRAPPTRFWGSGRGLASASSSRPLTPSRPVPEPPRHSPRQEVAAPELFPGAIARLERQLVNLRKVQDRLRPERRYHRYVRGATSATLHYGTLVTLDSSSFPRLGQMLSGQRTLSNL